MPTSTTPSLTPLPNSVQEQAAVSSLQLNRAFIRTVLRRVDTPESLSALYQSDAVKAAGAAIAEAETALDPSITELARLSTQAGGPVDWAHILVSVLPVLPLNAARHDAALVAATLRAAAAAAVARHAAPLRDAAVAEWTIRLRTRVEPGPPAACLGWRVVVSLPSGVLCCLLPRLDGGYVASQRCAATFLCLDWCHFTAVHSAAFLPCLARRRLDSQRCAAAFLP